jgi:hypothetical protein
VAEREVDAIPGVDDALRVAVHRHDGSLAILVDLAEPDVERGAAEVVGLGVVAEAVRGVGVALPDGRLAGALNPRLVDGRRDVALVADDALRWGRRRRQVVRRQRLRWPVAPWLRES